MKKLIKNYFRPFNKITKPIMRWALSYEYRPDLGQYVVGELGDQEGYLIDKDVFEYGLKLDGYTEYNEIDKSLPDSVAMDYIGVLNEYNLLRKTYKQKVYYHLFYPLYIPNRKKIKKLAEIYVKTLFTMTLPVLLIGTLIFINEYIWRNMNYYSAIGCWAGLVLAVIVHELSHLYVTIHFNPKGASEVDIAFWFHLFPQFCCVTRSKGRKQDTAIKIFIAGVMANAFLFGVLTIVAFIFRNDFILGMGIVNMPLIFTNIIPILNTDGHQIAEELLDKDTCYIKASKEFRILTIITLMILIVSSLIVTIYYLKQGGLI